MQRSAKYALIACVVVVVAGSVGFWWFVLRGDAPPEAALRERPEVTTTVDETDIGEHNDEGSGGETTTTEAVQADPDGTWVVETDGGDEVFVGYRILELFAGQTVQVEAAGRTGVVDGTLVIDGTQLTEVTIDADMSTLESDSGRRDDVLRTDGLSTDEFPAANFVLTESVELGAPPPEGESLELTLVGELTLRGVTQPVEVAVDARWNGDSIDVAGGADVLLADYAIPVISTSFVAIDDNGRFEFQLTFVPSAI